MKLFILGEEVDEYTGPRRIMPYYDSANEKTDVDVKWKIFKFPCEVRIGQVRKDSYKGESNISNSGWDSEVGNDPQALADILTEKCLIQIRQLSELQELAKSTKVQYRLLKLCVSKTTGDQITCLLVHYDGKQLRKQEFPANNADITNFIKGVKEGADQRIFENDVVFKESLFLWSPIHTEFVKNPQAHFENLVQEIQKSLQTNADCCFHFCPQGINVEKLSIAICKGCPTDFCRYKRA